MQEKQIAPQTGGAVRPKVLRSFEIRLWIQIGSDDSDSIRFESEIFESAAPAVEPQTTFTVQQKNFNHYAVVIEIYDYDLWFYVYV